MTNSTNGNGAQGAGTVTTDGVVRGVNDLYPAAVKRVVETGIAHAAAIAALHGLERDLDGYRIDRAAAPHVLHVGGLRRRLESLAFWCFQVPGQRAGAEQIARPIFWYPFVWQTTDGSVNQSFDLRCHDMMAQLEFRDREEAPQ